MDRFRPGAFKMPKPIPHAARQRQAAPEKKRDVRPERFSDGAQLPLRAGISVTTGQDRTGPQRRRGVGGPAAQSGPHGDALEQIKINPWGGRIIFLKRPGRPNHEVSGRRAQIGPICFKPHRPIRPTPRRERVHQGDFLEDGGHGVVPVRTTGKNFKEKVDFGG